MKRCITGIHLEIRNSAVHITLQLQKTRIKSSNFVVGLRGTLQISSSAIANYWSKTLEIVNVGYTFPFDGQTTIRMLGRFAALCLHLEHYLIIMQKFTKWPFHDWQGHFHRRKPMRITNFVHADPRN